MTELTPSSPSAQAVLTVVWWEGIRRWKAERSRSPGGTVAYGHGYAADACRFPAGTILEVTARIVMPREEASNAQD